MSKKLKRLRMRIIISLIIFVAAISCTYFMNNIDTALAKYIEWIQIALYLVAYFVVGFNILKKAISNIFHGELFDENFLMTLATAGAFATGEFPEGVMVMWLYQVGECFQQYAVGKSRKSITSLMDIRPDYANIESDGNLIEVSPEKINIGDLIVVKPGEKVPLDGVVVKGESSLDTSALTGESIPRKVSEGEEIFSGCINKNGLLTVKVTKKYDESTVSKILELVENASSRKAKAENFITKFAKIYTPVVVILALCLAFIPPLIIPNANIWDYIHRACSFLVISCPCALVISVPLSFFGSIGGASKQGILIKGSNYIEALAKTKTIALDKTGTITKGSFEVVKTQAYNFDEEKLIELSAFAECYSEHPIALSIKKAYGKEIDREKITNVEEIAGKGIKAQIEGNIVYIGNKKLMNFANVKFDEVEDDIGATIIYVALENKLIGNIFIADQIKEETVETIKELKTRTGIEEIVMLTGDNKEVAEKVAKVADIDTFYAELLPADKVNKVEEMMEKKDSNKSLVFVGDGLNDAPVLTRADIGIAMGGLGSDAAIEAADVVIMDDDVSKINSVINIAKRTLKIVKQNIVFAIAVKIIVLILGAFGIANMWEAVFADVGVTFIAVLNSMRTLRKM